MVRSEESVARLLGHILGQPLTNSVTLSRFLQIQCLFPDLDLLMLFMNPRLRKPNFLHNSNERNRAFILLTFFFFLYTQVVLVVKNLTADEGDVRDAGSIPGSGQSPGGGHNTTLQYSCLENPMDRGAWGASVHRVAESDTTEAAQHGAAFIIFGCSGSFLLTAGALWYRQATP